MIARAAYSIALCIAISGVAGAQGQASKAPVTRTTNTKAQAPQGRSTVRPDSAPAEIPVIMREVFDYNAEGRRDPFVSLLANNDLRPTLEELRLVSVLFDESGRRSIAVMRDGGAKQYRVTTGMTLGRMRVALITRNAVIFSIEEFGLNRTDSLVLPTSRTARP